MCESTRSGIWVFTGTQALLNRRMVGTIKMKYMLINFKIFRVIYLSTVITTETNDEQNRKYLAPRGLTILLLFNALCGRKQFGNLSGNISTLVLSQRTCYPKRLKSCYH